MPFSIFRCCSKAASTRCCVVLLCNKPRKLIPNTLMACATSCFLHRRRQQVPDARGVAFTNGVFPGLDRATSSGRDHGLDSYNDIRETLGLKRLKTFEEITSIRIWRNGSRISTTTTSITLISMSLAQRKIMLIPLGEVGTIINANLKRYVMVIASGMKTRRTSSLVRSN